MGELRLLLIEEHAGVWEEEWEPLRGTVFGNQFTQVTKEVLDHAMHRYSRPLVNSLGPIPEGALRKIPPVSRECYQRKKCPLYSASTCFPEAEKMPWCFEPAGVEAERVRSAASRAIEQWRERVYLVIVKER